MNTYDSNRAFRLWDYRIGHNQLLLRSPKTGSEPTNIDVIFWGVEFVDLPSMLKQIAVRSAEKRPAALTSHSSKVKTFAIKCGDTDYFVLAAGCQVFENDLEPNVTSLDVASEPEVDRGRVLAEVKAE